MTETGMHAETLGMDPDLNLSQANENRKPSFIARVIKKLVSWSLTIVVCVGFYMLISNLQGKQKEEFFEQSQQKAVIACGANSTCIAKVKTHFDACIAGNYSSYKKGKYSRKYVFDLEGFQGCLDAK